MHFYERVSVEVWDKSHEGTTSRFRVVNYRNLTFNAKPQENGTELHPTDICIFIGGSVLRFITNLMRVRRAVFE